MTQSEMAEMSRPYMRLWLAVLYEATMWYQQGCKHGWEGYGEAAIERRRAKQWFESNDKTPRSFLWVCDVFDMQPEKFRGMLPTRTLRDAMRRVEYLLNHPVSHAGHIDAFG